MTISDNYEPDVTVGNGVTTVFTGNWSPLAAEYMKVALQTVSTGVIAAPLSQGGGASEYTLTFTSSGYSVTLGTAPTSSYNVIRYREVGLTQEVNYTTSKGFQGDVHTASYDKLTAICQDLHDDVSRSIAFAVGSSSTTTVPEPNDGYVLGWDGAELANLAPNTDAYINPANFITDISDLTSATPATGDYIAGSDTSDANNNKKFLVSDIVALGGNNKPQDFRLTLTTGLPVTTADVTGATTIYCTPYVGNSIALYDGSSAWNVRTSAQFSLALGTLSNNTNYDVFCYDNAGTPTLEFTAWSGDTTRATALAYQDGVLVKTGATTRRYLGTFRTTATTTTEDSKAKRYLWNYYNRRRRYMERIDATASWTYTTQTFRQANASTSNQLNFLIGVAEDNVEARLLAMWDNTGGTFATSAIALDSTSTRGGVNAHSTNTGGSGYEANVAFYDGVPAAGYHYLAWLEWSVASGTTTWHGTGTNTTSGIYGTIMA